MADATRFAYLIVILGSLLLNEDPGQAPERQSRDLGDLFASLEEEQPWRDSDWDANAQPVLEASLPWRFLNTFLPPESGASCLSRRLLLACLSGLLRVFLLWMGNWLASRRVTDQRPQAEVDSNREPDQHGEGWLPLARPSSSCYALAVPASASTSGECLISGFDSYELPWKRQRHIPEGQMAEITFPAAVETRDPKGGVFEGEAHTQSLPFLILKHRGENVLPASPSSEKPPELPPPPEEPVEALVQPLELPGKDEAAAGPPDRKRGREEAGGLQLELAGTPRCTAPPASEEREDAEALKQPREPPRRGEAEETQPQRDSSSSGVPSRSLHTLGGGAAAAGGAEEETGGASTSGGAAPGAKEDRSPEARFQRPEIEGQLRCALLTASPEEGREASAPGRKRGREEAGGLQLELAGTPRCMPPTPSNENEGAEAPGSGRHERKRLGLQDSPAALPSSEAHKKWKCARPETERDRPFRQGAPPPFVQEKVGAADETRGECRRERRGRGAPQPSTNQRRAKGRRVRPGPRSGCIPWASLCLVWVKTKAKRGVNRLVDHLRRRHRAAPHDDLDPHPAAGGRSAPCPRDRVGQSFYTIRSPVDEARARVERADIQPMDRRGAESGRGFTGRGQPQPSSDQRGGEVAQGQPSPNVDSFAKRMMALLRRRRRVPPPNNLDPHPAAGGRSAPRPRDRVGQSFYTIRSPVDEARARVERADIQPMDRRGAESGRGFTRRGHPQPSSDQRGGEVAQGQPSPNVDSFAKRMMALLRRRRRVPPPNNLDPHPAAGGRSAPRPRDRVGQPFYTIRNPVDEARAQFKRADIQPMDRRGVESGRGFTGRGHPQPSSDQRGGEVAQGQASPNVDSFANRLMAPRDALDPHPSAGGQSAPRPRDRVGQSFYSIRSPVDEARARVERADIQPADRRGAESGRGFTGRGHPQPSSDQRGGEVAQGQPSPNVDSFANRLMAPRDDLDPHPADGGRSAPHPRDLVGQSFYSIRSPVDEARARVERADIQPVDRRGAESRRGFNGRGHPQPSSDQRGGEVAQGRARPNVDSFANTLMALPRRRRRAEPRDGLDLHLGASVQADPHPRDGVGLSYIIPRPVDGRGAESRRGVTGRGQPQPSSDQRGGEVEQGRASPEWDLFVNLVMAPHNDLHPHPAAGGQGGEVAQGPASLDMDLFVDLLMAPHDALDPHPAAGGQEGEVAQGQAEPEMDPFAMGIRHWNLAEWEFIRVNGIRRVNALRDHN
ncbi:uncharacterized protein LOC140702537 isoform X1 [Pogona vitticeps]